MDTTITISARKLAAIYISISVILLFVAILTSAANRVVRQSALSDEIKLAMSQGQLRFAPDAEQNLPTWYSSFSLLSCAVLSGIIGLGRRAARSRDWPYWVGLVILFLIMSIDEVATFHEFTTYVVVLFYKFSGLLKYSWLVIGLPLILGLALVYLRWWWRLPPRTRLVLALAALIFITGAAVFEMFEGYIEDVYGTNQPATIVLVFLEEFFEMIGSAILIFGLADYAANISQTTFIQVKFLK